MGPLVLLILGFPYFGINANLSWNPCSKTPINSQLEILRQRTREIKTMGTPFSRFDLAWQKLETDCKCHRNRPVKSFWFVFDSLLEWHARWKIPFLLILDYTAPYASSMPDCDFRGVPYSVALWDSTLQKVKKRLDTKKINFYVQVWNEPNNYLLIPGLPHDPLSPEVAGKLYRIYSESLLVPVLNIFPDSEIVVSGPSHSYMAHQQMVFSALSNLFEIYRDSERLPFSRLALHWYSEFPGDTSIFLNFPKFLMRLRGKMEYWLGDSLKAKKNSALGFRIWTGCESSCGLQHSGFLSFTNV